ncbi:MAG: 3-deoxy-D-manno-octulosonic acid transferase [Hymenobacteraceae bacterium]|nr:3-deoxy-D-manno-octulosonic acid transferase [Hymenobacteraceae bacterium]
MALFLYNLAVQLYATLIWLLAPLRPKAAHWVRGRRQWDVRLKAALARNPDPVLWMHCASLGEFEQGRPVLENLRQRHGERLRILLTFFSPSGYDVRQNWTGADWVFYLPLDSASNAARFIDIVRPVAAIFVKYEFWHYYLRMLQRHEVPTFLIAAALRPDQIFFRPWGGFFRRMLHSFTRIFSQNDATAELLRGIGYPNVTVAGDPRFDRVRGTAVENRRLSLVNAFVSTGEPVLVVGSAWPQDLAALAPTLRRHAATLKVIVAPHEISPADIAAVEGAFTGMLSIRYSQATAAAISTPDERAVTPELLSACRVLIIDNVGMLSALYGYATVAYVGGAFGKGLHNVLEAAVFGAPVLFGPRIGRFPEATALVKAGGAVSVATPDALDAQLTTWLTTDKTRLAAGAAAAAYVYSNAGATARILTGIAPWLPPVSPTADASIR